MMSISCPDPGTLTRSIPHLSKQIEGRGFALLEAWDSQPETFKYMAQHFGQLQRHIRGDEDGIVSVAYEKSWNSSLSEDDASSIQQEDFQSYSADYVAPHTDGTFIHGMNLNAEGKVIRVLPPRLVGFQCVQPAESGGELILVDAKKVLLALMEEKPELISILFRPGCISFCRDDQLALDMAVFGRMPDVEQWAVRIHFDKRVFTSSWSYEAVEIAYKQYFDNPQYAVKIALKSNQILLIDNRRVLHGRSIYQVYGGRNVRFHRRLWIGNPEPIVFNSAGKNVNHRRAWDCYQNYRYLPNPLETNIRPIACGIRLDAGDRQTVQTLLNNAESLVV